MLRGVALTARLRSPERQKQLGYSGSWTTSPGKLSNEYFTVLLGNEWVQHEVRSRQRWSSRPRARRASS